MDASSAQRPRGSRDHALTHDTWSAHHHRPPAIATDDDDLAITADTSVGHF
jgi:hypothetical protein